MSLSPAAEEGFKILRRYQSRKQISLDDDFENSATPASKIKSTASDVGSTSFVDAIADGTQLFTSYTQSKRKRAIQEGSINPVEPVEAMKLLVLELETVHDDAKTKQIAQSLLHTLDIIDTYEKRDSVPMEGIKIDFSPTQTPMQAKTIDSAMRIIGTVNEVNPYQPGQKTIIKQYMKNELERNESELEYYDNLISNLVNKCEALQDEKNNLTIDLDLYMMEKQKLTHENMELQQRLNQLQDEQQAVVSSMQEQAFQLQTEIDELKQRLQFNNEAFTLNEEKISLLQNTLQAKESQSIQDLAQLNDLKLTLEYYVKQSDELSDQMNSLQSEKIILNQQIENISTESLRMSQRNHELQVQLHSFEAMRLENTRLTVELDDYRVEIDHLNSELQMIRSATTSPLHTNQTPSIQSQTDNEKLAFEINTKNSLLQQLEEKLQRENQRISELNQTNLKLQQQISTLQSEISDKLTTIGATEMTTVVDMSIKDIRMPIVQQSDRPHREVDGDLMEAKNILRTYMGNQLDLNISEYDSYIKQIEKLADTLEMVNLEKQNLLEFNERLLREREELEGTIQQLRSTIENQIDINIKEIVENDQSFHVANRLIEITDEPDIEGNNESDQLEDVQGYVDIQSGDLTNIHNLPKLKLVKYFQQLYQKFLFCEEELSIKTQELEYADQALSDVRERVKSQLVSNESGIIVKITSELEAAREKVREYEAELEAKVVALAVAEKTIADIKEKIALTQSPSETFPPNHYLYDDTSHSMATNQDFNQQDMDLLKASIQVKEEVIQELKQQLENVQSHLKEQGELIGSLKHEKLTDQEKILLLETHLLQQNELMSNQLSAIEGKEMAIKDLQELLSSQSTQIAQLTNQVVSRGSITTSRPLLPPTSDHASTSHVSMGDPFITNTGPSSSNHYAAMEFFLLGASTDSLDFSYSVEAQSYDRNDNKPAYMQNTSKPLASLTPFSRPQENQQQPQQLLEHQQQQQQQQQPFELQEHEKRKLHEEIQSLKQLLESKISEIDILKSKEMRFDSESQLQLLLEEKRALQYQHVIDDLQYRYDDANKQAGSAQQELIKSRQNFEEIANQLDLTKQELTTTQNDIVSFLASIKKLENANQVSTEIINELNVEKGYVNSKVNALLSEMQEANEKINAQHDEIKLISGQYNLLATENETNKAAILLEKSKLEELQAKYELEIEKISYEYQSQISSLSKQIKTIQNEKNEFEILLQNQQGLIFNLERELTEKSTNIHSSNFNQEKLKGVILQYQTVFKLQESHFINSFQSKYNSLFAHIDKLQQNLSQYKSLHELKQNRIHEQYDHFESQINNAQDALSNVWEENEVILLKFNDLQTDYDNIRLENEELKKSIQETRIECDIKINSIVSSEKQVLYDEIYQLQQKLQLVEKQSAEISTNGAKVFAKTSRTIALLEADVIRLKSLIDHFKLVNIQLNEDLKVAQIEAMKVTSYDNRFQLQLENESKILLRMSEFEDALREKESQILQLSASYQHEIDHRADEYDNELTSLTDKVKQLQSQCDQLIINNNNQNEILESSRNAFQLEKDSILAKLATFSSDYESVSQQLHDAKGVISTLRAAVNAKDTLLSDAEMKMSLITQDAENYGHQLSKKRDEYENENKFLIAKLHALEVRINEMKLSLEQSEATNISKDEVITTSMNNHLQIVNENRQLENTISELRTEMQSLTSEYEDQTVRFRHVTAELETLRQHYTQLKDFTHKDTVTKLYETEKLLRESTEENDELERILNSMREDLASVSEKLNENDLKYQSLVSTLASCQGQNDAYHATVQNLTDENANIRSQIDALTIRATDQTKEIAQLRNELLLVTNNYELLTLKYDELNSSSKSVHEKCLLYQNFSSELANKMKNLSESISSKVDAINHELGGSNPGNRQTTASEIFASPVPVVSQSGYRPVYSPIRTNLQLMTEAPQSSYFQLEDISTNFEDLQLKFDFFLQQHNKSQLLVISSNKELYQQKTRGDTLESQLNTISLERDRLCAQFGTAEVELVNMKTELDSISLERNKLLDEKNETLTYLKQLMAQLTEYSTNLCTKLSTVLIFQLTNLSKSDQNISSDSLINYQASHGIHDLISYSNDFTDKFLVFTTEHFEALVKEINLKSKIIQNLENSISDKEHAWVTERTTFIEQIHSLGQTIEMEQNRSEMLLSEIQQCKQDIEQLESKLNEVSSNNSALELEYKYSTENINELKSSLSTADNLCLDLKSTIKCIQYEYDKQTEQTKALQQQLTALQKTLSDQELHIEKNSTLLTRTQLEKEAAENVRKSIEIELKRVQVEVNYLRSNRTLVGAEDSKASYQAEKLLAALGTSIDQINSSFDSKATADFSSLDLSSNSNGSNAALLSARVDSAIKRLNDLRSSAREFHRSKRSIENLNLTLTAEVTSLRKALADSQNRLGQLIKTSSDLDMNSKETVGLIVDLQNEGMKFQGEIYSLRDQINQLSLALEEEKRIHHQLAAESRNKEHRISYLHQQLEDGKNMESKLKQDNEALNDQLNDMNIQYSKQVEVLRINKMNNDKLSKTLEMIESSIKQERRERHLLEQKLAVTESTIEETVKVKRSELDVVLKSTQERLKLVEEHNQSLSSQNVTLTQEIESHRQIVETCKSKLSNIEAEKICLQTEIKSLKYTSQVQLQQLEAERLSRLKSESALNTLTANIESRVSSQIDHSYSQIVENIESKFSIDEKEKISLQSKIHKLSLLVEEKENVINTHTKKIENYENDMNQLKRQLDKSTREVEEANNRSASMRVEGRQARARIKQCISQISEVVNIIKVDAKAMGAELKSAMKLDETKGPPSARTDSESGLGLLDALTIPELSTAVADLVEFLPWLRDVPKEFIALQSKLRRVEGEKTKLERESAAQEKKYEDSVSNFKEELQVYKSQLADSKRLILEHSVSEMSNSQRQQVDKLLTLEKKEKEKLVETISLLREENSMITRQLHAMTQDMQANRTDKGLIAQMTHENASVEIDILRREVNEARQEWKAVSHHRNVLRDTVEHLEKQIKNKSDEIADVLSKNEKYSSCLKALNRDPELARLISVQLSTYKDSSLDRSNGSNVLPEDDEEDILRNQCHRLRTRTLAMEELVSMYRMGIIALYPDGSSYNLAQYSNLQNNDSEPDGQLSNLTGVNSSWIQKEIEHIRKSYEEEIRLYDMEICELRNKLRHSESYISELRKRFDEVMGSIYRGVSKDGHDGLVRQLDHMTQALQRCETEIQEVNQQLGNERQDGRIRHSDLVSDLTKALQSREIAIQALKSLENACHKAGLSTQGMYEGLRGSIPELSESRNNQSDHAGRSKSFDITGSRAIANLRQGLVETDHELYESERRAKRAYSYHSHQSSQPGQYKHQSQSQTDRHPDESFDTGLQNTSTSTGVRLAKDKDNSTSQTHASRSTSVARTRERESSGTHDKERERLAERLRQDRETLQALKASTAALLHAGSSTSPARLLTKSPTQPLRQSASANTNSGAIRPNLTTHSIFRLDPNDRDATNSSSLRVSRAVPGAARAKSPLQSTRNQK